MSNMPAALFTALELAHYAERYRHARFVILLSELNLLEPLLLDLKVLQSYRIGAVVVAPLDDPEVLANRVSTANKHGMALRLLLSTAILDEAAARSLPHLDLLRAATAEGAIPLVAYQLEPSTEPDQPRPADETPHSTTPPAERPAAPNATLASFAARLACALDAKKLFLAGTVFADFIAAAPFSHLHSAQLQTWIDAPAAASPSRAVTSLLPFSPQLLLQWLQHDPLDLVLIEGKGGEVFREVFTHDGVGLLLNNRRHSEIRPARLADVTDIALLLKPEIHAGRVLSVQPEEIEAQLANYFVYDIAGLVCGAVCLRHYGADGELAKFVTLPRYRRQGQARQLALHLEQIALQRGLQHLFALSTDERMGRFFVSLGYQTISRKTLPLAWQQQYDWHRNSRAFIKALVPSNTDPSHADPVAPPQ